MILLLLSFLHVILMNLKNITNFEKEFKDKKNKWNYNDISLWFMQLISQFLIINNLLHAFKKNIQVNKVEKSK